MKRPIPNSNRKKIIFTKPRTSQILPAAPPKVERSESPDNLGAKDTRKIQIRTAQWDAESKQDHESVTQDSMVVVSCQNQVRIFQTPTLCVDCWGDIH